MHFSGHLQKTLQQKTEASGDTIMTDALIYCGFAWLIYNNNPVHGPVYAFCFLYTFIVRRAR
jgi:hypothetical protein